MLHDAGTDPRFSTEREEELEEEIARLKSICADLSTAIENINDVVTDAMESIERELI